MLGFFTYRFRAGCEKYRSMKKFEIYKKYGIIF